MKEMFIPALLVAFLLGLWSPYFAASVRVDPPKAPMKTTRMVRA